MRLRSMFTSQCSPIAIDFGSSSLKMLQVTTAEKPELVAAVEHEIPDELRSQPQQRLEYCIEQVPELLKSGRFKGRRVVCAAPSEQTFVQHMQLSGVNESNLTEATTLELQNRIGCSPSSVVVRAIDVTDVLRKGQTRREVICLAIKREAVMRIVQALERRKLETIGVHTQLMSMVRAFHHLNRRTSDKDVTTLYLDMGWCGTSAAITHGQKLVFARYIPIGGNNFDQHVCEALQCDPASARAHRMSIIHDPQKELASFADFQKAPAPQQRAHENTGECEPTDTETETESATATATGERRKPQIPPELQHAVNVNASATEPAQTDFSELLDTLVDELTMCLRYHNGLFSERKLNRVILLGGEARQPWLCQRIVKGLRVPGQLGDPIARYTKGAVPDTPGLLLGEPQPGWASPCGLCAMTGEQ